MKPKMTDSQYKDFLYFLKQKIYSAKSQAILSANRLMIELYFEIGKEIIAKQEALGWGKSVVEQMSKDLIDEFGEKSGYSGSNLWRMRNFYLSYKDNEKLAQLVREISWGQNILVFEKCKDTIQKEYYIKNTIENGWNRNVLMHHIKTNLFERDKVESYIEPKQFCENSRDVSTRILCLPMYAELTKEEQNLKIDIIKEKKGGGLRYDKHRRA